MKVKNRDFREILMKYKIKCQKTVLYNVSKE